MRRLWTDIKRLLGNDGGWVIAGVVTAVVSAVASATFQVLQAQQQAKIADYNKKVAENNALAARQAAAVQAENERDKMRLLMASQRAGIGASGVLPSEGTPLLFQIDSAEKAALNEARIRYSGEAGARAQESEAIIQGYLGRQALTRGYVQAGSTLLQGATSTAGIYGKSGGGKSTLADDTTYIQR